MAEATLLRGELSEREKQSVIGSVPGLNPVLFCAGLQGRGSTLIDRSGNANHGTIVGAAWKRLPSGLLVLSFDGAGDYVGSFTTANFEVGTGVFTLECWARTSVGGCLIVKQHGASPYRGYQYFVRTDNGKLQFSANDAANVFLDVSVGSSLLDNIWRHLVMVKQLPTSYLYINSTQYSVDASLLTGSLTYAPCPFQIGARDDTFSNPFTGEQGLWRVFIGYAMTSAVVTSHYQRERHLFRA